MASASLNVGMTTLTPDGAPTSDALTSTAVMWRPDVHCAGGTGAQATTSAGATDESRSLPARMHANRRK
jgi:hypothetical protein